jgi:hypothetical protein
MNKIPSKEMEQSFLQFFKICETYVDSGQRETNNTINKVLDKNTFSRAHCKYKKKLYNRKISAKLKDVLHSIY